ncbi:MAG TPA: hypothetical protein VE089_00470 [Nitrososphaeraceae archaeon]|jgi:hypothetical protein|nr:hypothetical protein [Nitrososphaeraceae archaeon]
MSHFVVTRLIYYIFVDLATMRKKFFAIIGALIAGGLGFAVANSAPAAHAALTAN